MRTSPWVAAGAAAALMVGVGIVTAAPASADTFYFYNCDIIQVGGATVNRQSAMRSVEPYPNGAYILVVKKNGNEMVWKSTGPA